MLSTASKASHYLETLSSYMIRLENTSGWLWLWASLVDCSTINKWSASRERKHHQHKNIHQTHIYTHGNSAPIIFSYAYIHLRSLYFGRPFGNFSSPMATGVVDLVRHGQGHSINKSPCVKPRKLRCKQAWYLFSRRRNSVDHETPISFLFFLAQMIAVTIQSPVLAAATAIRIDLDTVSSTGQVTLVGN